MSKLLLLSNSTNFDEPYLYWPIKHISAFLEDVDKPLLFVPYAGVSVDWNSYHEKVNGRFESLGHQTISIHEQADALKAIEDARAIIIGGGNSFHLLYHLQQNKLLNAIRLKVENGCPYIGWSAGSNVACPTIMTTNDMPVIEPADFKALNLVPFQINPHYTEKTIAGHGGETREMRIQEFLEINPGLTVLGLPEGSLLEVQDDQMYFKGEGILKIFRKGNPVRESPAGRQLDWLLKS